MNAQKFTQKSLEAIAEAQSVAAEHASMQIEQQHLLYALAQQQDGLIGSLLGRMGVDAGAFRQDISAAIAAIPGVSGPGREPDKIYVAPDVDGVLAAAERQTGQMRDDYVSVEHLFLALLQAPNTALEKLFKKYAITRDAFLKVLMSIRGNARVTSDSPEDTYDVLKKYGTDLVEQARKQ